MKRSNLFLALTTGCLAVASFAFAKSHKVGAIHTGYCFTSQGSNNCVLTTTGKRWSVNKVGNATARCSNGQIAHQTKIDCVHTLYTANN
jgi:hypothetical protein